MLNIGYYASYHVDHTVTALGWISYLVYNSEETRTVLTFYRIHDGDCYDPEEGDNADRYVCDDSIVGVFVTKVY